MSENNIIKKTRSKNKYQIWINIFSNSYDTHV